MPIYICIICLYDMLISMKQTKKETKRQKTVDIKYIYIMKHNTSDTKKKGKQYV